MEKKEKKIKKIVDTFKEFDDWKNILIDMGGKFECYVGSFSQKLIQEGEGGLQVEWYRINYSKKVLGARNKILKDVRNSKFAQEVLTHPTYPHVNFNIHDIPEMNLDRAFCIDLVSAYPYTLLNSGIIPQSTFDYIQALPKNERLPAIGMLAKRQTIEHWENGKHTKNMPKHSETENIFYYTIHHVQQVMNTCKSILSGLDEPYYYFHWVDGIFFSVDTPKDRIQMLEEYLDDCAFKYKWESVKNLVVKRVEEDSQINFVISMEKMGVTKTYSVPYFPQKTEDEKRRYIATYYDKRRNPKDTKQ